MIISAGLEVERGFEACPVGCTVCDSCIGKLRLKAETKIVMMKIEHRGRKVNLVVAWIWADRGECKITALMGGGHLVMRNQSREGEC